MITFPSEDINIIKNLLMILGNHMKAGKYVQANEILEVLIDIFNKKLIIERNLLMDRGLIDQDIYDKFKINREI